MSSYNMNQKNAIGLSLMPLAECALRKNAIRLQQGCAESACLGCVSQHPKRGQHDPLALLAGTCRTSCAICTRGGGLALALLRSLWTVRPDNHGLPHQGGCFGRTSSLSAIASAARHCVVVRSEQVAQSSFVTCAAEVALAGAVGVVPLLVLTNQRQVDGRALAQKIGVAHREA